MKFDLVVFDSTSAGIIAAIAAAERGLHVAIVTEDAHVGAMQTSGLGWTNAGQRAIVSGLTREFHNRVLQYYVDKYGKDAKQVEVCSDGFHWEPHVGLAIFNDWLDEKGVRVMRNTRIRSVEKNGRSLTALVIDDDHRIEAKAFIDASYEGDLLAMAGCDFHVGRESSATYTESLAGVRWPESEKGMGDAKLQPFDYRFCLTNNPNNRVAFTQPPGYDPARYKWHGAKFRDNPPERLHAALPLNPMPNQKTDSRTGEWVGGSYDWPSASPDQRQKIAIDHLHYSEGYIWFLLTEGVLPSNLRDELATWGYAADEFLDNNHRPYHVYVREARRLVGDYVMTQPDVLDDRHKKDGVAIGSFYLDVHPVQFVDDPQGEGPNSHAGLCPEGSVGKINIRPYEIPYRTLLPKESQATNLLAPVALSASHVAFSTIRMEPVWSMLGQAAGVAASLAIENGSAVQQVETGRLRALLIAQGQFIDAHDFPDLWPNWGK